MIQNIVLKMSLIMFLFCCAISADEPITKETSDKQYLRSVYHKELSGILIDYEKAKDQWEVHKRFQTYPKEQRLESLAYALKEGINSKAALMVILNDKEMQDSRLTPFLNKVLQESKGEDLFCAVVVVKRLPPDQALLEPLMNYALQGDYVKWSLHNDGRHASMSVRSTFNETAEAIYKITGGEIGLKIRREDFDPSEQEKQNLIKKWRETYSAKYKSGK